MLIQDPSLNCDYCPHPADYVCDGITAGFRPEIVTSESLGRIILLPTFKEKAFKIERIDNYSSTYLELHVVSQPKRHLKLSVRWRKGRALQMLGPCFCKAKTCYRHGCERSEQAHRCHLHWGLDGQKVVGIG